MVIPWYRSQRCLVGIVASAVAIADLFFYAHTIGWTSGLYLLFLTGFVVFRSPHLLRHPAGLALTFGLIGLATALGGQPGPLPVAMAVPAVVALALMGRAGWVSSTIEWMRRWAYFSAKSIVQLPRDFFIAHRWVQTGHHHAGSIEWKRVFRNWSIPISISLFFLLMFLVANPILLYWVHLWEKGLEEWFSTWGFSLGRLFFWFLTAAFAWSLLRTRVSQGKRALNLRPQSGSLLRPGILVRCLALFNVVFAVQSTMDVVYLWGGRALPEGMTYAEYAHRGAYPLIATALLAALFVLITFRDGAPTRELKVARGLVYAWLGQNVFLTISSIWRLHLYIDVYGLTRWRIAAALWMALVACGLLLIGARILIGRSNKWLVNSCFLTTVFVLYLCCFVNFNNIIAWSNVIHSREAGGNGYRIDLNYLETLGTEAIPALDWLAQRSPCSGACQLSWKLKRQLKQQTSEWQGWTWRRGVLQRYVDHGTLLITESRRP